jgi:hypothetical protein
MTAGFRIAVFVGVFRFRFCKLDFRHEATARIPSSRFKIRFNQGPVIHRLNPGWAAAKYVYVN